MNKREREIFEGQLNDEDKVLKDLERIYQKARRDIENKIKLLQSDELTNSRIYQIQYQKALKGQIDGILEKLHGDEFSTIQKYLSDTYTNGFVGTMYAMHGQGVPVMIPIDRRAAAKAVVTDSKLSVDLYASLGYDMDILKKHVREEITRGIATSLPYEQIGRNIANYTSLPLSNATRIARTEGHRIQQASADDARKKAKAKGADLVKQWDASLDGATRPLHRRLDGQIREIDEPFEAGGKKVMYPGKFNDPGQDCNCRCVALTRARSALDKKELETLKERAEFFGLDKTEDFEDFKQKYLKAVETEQLKKPYNKKTIKGQYKLTEALNEYDYFEEDQEAFRLSAIKEMSGADEKQAAVYLEALCGRRDDYIRTSNSGAEYAEAWFYGADAKIRAGTSEHYRKQAETIHDYILRSPKFEGEIYRGLSLDDDQIARFNVGSEFEENGLLSSWTSSADVADMFAQGRSEELGAKPVIIKMKNPRYGTPVSHLSIFGQEEEEVLVSNIENTKYTVASVNEENGVTIIELRE